MLLLELAGVAPVAGLAAAAAGVVVPVPRIEPSCDTPKPKPKVAKLVKVLPENRSPMVVEKPPPGVDVLAPLELPPPPELPEGAPLAPPLVSTGFVSIGPDGVVSTGGRPGKVSTPPVRLGSLSGS